MPEAPVLRPAEAVAAAARRLADAGVEEPRREASRLWAAIAGGPVALSGEGRGAEEGIGAYERAVARRAGGEPFAHVTGMAGFRHLDLAADRRALIPRPETEGLVELLLGRVRTGVVADIGTGTGCIALSLAAEGAYAAVIALDRSADALALAADNARRTGAPVALVRGDLTAPLATGSVDALVSNPPYLSEAEYAALDPAVRSWEPALALVSGPDGLDATTRLLDDGRRVVRPGGRSRRSGTTRKPWRSSIASRPWPGRSISWSPRGRFPSRPPPTSTRRRSASSR